MLRRSEAAEEDFRFWYEELTPEQRVEAVEECLLSALRAKGVDEIPRLRRVSRVVQRPGSAKRSAGRDQDRADLEHLKRAKTGR